MSNALTSPAADAVSAAPFLFSPDIIRELTAAEARGEYTLERIKEKRPGLIESIIELRGRGEGLLSIAKLLGCSHHTVSKVDDAYPESIAIARDKRIRCLRRTGDKLVEQISNNPDCVPGHAKALAASQLYDKAELLDGKPTGRVEHVERVDIYGDWPAFIEKQLSSAREVAPGMGLGAGNLPAISEGDVEREREGLEEEAGSGSEAGTDVESDDSREPNEVGSKDVTAFVATQEAEQGAQEPVAEGRTVHESESEQPAEARRRGGDAIDQHELDGSTGNDDQKFLGNRSASQ